jgi:hypothetical protein
MVLDLHVVYIDERSCPLWPWAAIFGSPRWLCWLAVRGERCSSEFRRRCPLTFQSENACDSGGKSSAADKVGARR